MPELRDDSLVERNAARSVLLALRKEAEGMSPYDDNWLGDLAMEASASLTIELIEWGLKQMMKPPRRPVVMIPASWSITPIGPLPPGWRCVNGKPERTSDVER